MSLPKLVVLLSPLATWGFLYLAVRFGGLPIRIGSPWVKFVSIALLIGGGLLFITDSRYADAPMMCLYAVWTAAWWLERRSNLRV